MGEFVTCENVTIEWLDNGYIVNISGTTKDGYANRKFMGDEDFVIATLNLLMGLPRE